MVTHRYPPSRARFGETAFQPFLLGGIELIGIKAPETNLPFCKIVVTMGKIPARPFRGKTDLSLNISLVVVVTEHRIENARELLVERKEFRLPLGIVGTLNAVGIEVIAEQQCKLARSRLAEALHSRGDFLLCISASSEVSEE